VSRLRLGELAALAGVVCIALALALPWYQTAAERLDAWSTFGAAIVLLMLAALAALALVAATATERSTALPVAAAVWSTLFGLIATVAAVIRALELPQRASGTCAGT
jgi:hypothetical protein